MVSGEGGNSVCTCVFMYSDTCDYVCETGGDASECVNAKNVYVCAQWNVSVNAYVQI